MRVDQGDPPRRLLREPCARRSIRAGSRTGWSVHLLGLVSYGGVHSHIDHVRALLALARREGMEDRTIVDAFTDGRDVSPRASASDLRELVEDGRNDRVGRGQVLAMDRDKRWERTDRALRRDHRLLGEQAGRTIPLQLSKRATRKGSPTSSSSRSSSTPRLSQRTTQRSSSTSAPIVHDSSASASSNAVST